MIAKCKQLLINFRMEIFMSLKDQPAIFKILPSNFCSLHAWQFERHFAKGFIFFAETFLTARINDALGEFG